MTTMNDHIGQPLRDLLDRILHEMIGEKPDIDYERIKDEFVFHLTECIDDLDKYLHLCKSPLTHDLQTAERIVQGLLYHAVGHLISACRKYDYVPDPFKELDERSSGSGKQIKEENQDGTHLFSPGN
jgi:hypothetical protein